jgi:serine/threonine-protein kinase
MEELQTAGDQRLAIPTSAEAVGDDSFVLVYKAPQAIGPTDGSKSLLDAQQGIALLRQVADLLDDLHDRGAVHGSLTRHSLWRGNNGGVAVPDFGIVPYLNGAIAEPSDIMAYWAPERWRGAKPTPRSDQYALAVIAWEVMVGRPRRTSQSDVGVVSVEALELDMFTKLRALDAKAALTTLKRALSPDPLQRFPTCGEFAAALASDVGAPAADQRVADATDGSSRRMSPRVAVVTILVAAMIVAGALYLFQQRAGATELRQLQPVAAPPVDSILQVER